jgi:DNA-binding transcriptional MerR regulator
MADRKKAARLISELAAEFDISTRTIRFYEEKGLLAPARTRAGTGLFFRDRARLKLILRGKRFGYRLEEIADMIGPASEERDEAEQIRRALAYGERNLSEIHRRVEELNLLEQDIRAVKSKLLARLAELERKPADRKEGSCLIF